MSDQEIIDLTHLKMLRDYDSNLTKRNTRLKLRFVNIADALIQQVIERPDYEFLKVFKESLPEEVLGFYKFGIPGLDRALDDLNIISRIEVMLGLNPVIFGPQGTEANPSGWISGFYMADCMFSSPEMATEAKARAFSIILFARMKDVLKG